MAVFKRRNEVDDSGISEASQISRPRTSVQEVGGTRIGPGLTVDGRIRAKEEVRVQGKVTGNMDVRGKVVVEAGGEVTANIKADEIVIRGRVKGDIDCQRANIEPVGELIGDVASPRMILADGAVFKGKIDMAPKEAPARGSGKSAKTTGTSSS